MTTWGGGDKMGDLGLWISFFSVSAEFLFVSVLPRCPVARVLHLELLLRCTDIPAKLFQFAGKYRLYG